MLACLGRQLMFQSRLPGVNVNPGMLAGCTKRLDVGSLFLAKQRRSEGAAAKAESGLSTMHEARKNRWIPRECPTLEPLDREEREAKTGCGPGWLGTIRLKYSELHGDVQVAGDR